MPGNLSERRQQNGTSRFYDRFGRQPVSSGQKTGPAASGLRKVSEDRQEVPEGAFFSVLVAECHPAILQVVGAMFKALGCRVSSACGVRAAVNHLAQTPFNLVVSEFKMEVVNGCQLAAYVKANSPRTRVLVMTGCCQSEVAAQMRSPHVDGWIFKPFGFEELLDALEEMKLARACPRFCDAQRPGWASQPV